MRLRLTVRRHRLPDTLVIWAIDTTSNPTIYHLLEQVNDTIPIESDGQWGLDDYAVEVKGSTGANFECLHFQHLASVIKDEDEVIIRPLLSQDVKIRRVSGRVQISTDGRHLVDGVPWGRPLLRKAGDRPAVNIPPRKRQRIEYSEDDEDPEGFQALKDKEAEDSEPENNRQLVLHADFEDDDEEDDDEEDDDEEDDDDFAPGEDEDAEEDDGSEEDLEENKDEKEVEDEEEPSVDLNSHGDAADDANEPALADVKDQATRTKIRKLHSAFPKSPLAVCKYVFNGSEDIGEAYEAMARGFMPEKPKSAVTEISQGVNEDKLSMPRIRSKAKTPSVHEPEILDSMQVEPDENALIDYYDQNGLPLGSIKSGKALSVMAEALKGSPVRPPTESRRPASVTSNKDVRFALDASFSEGLTSTPFIDKEFQVEEEESEEDSDDESSESNEEDTSSSEDSSDSSDDEAEEAKGSSDGTSSSESASESSSDSSSDDDESPEETSSKKEATGTAPVIIKTTSPFQTNKSTAQPRASPGHGKPRTHARNKRRRDANMLDRFVTKGILPAGTELADFRKLDVDDTTPPDIALAALDEVKAARTLKQANERTGPSLSQDPGFERRRQELLASLAAGGVEVDSNFSRKTSQSPPAQAGHDIKTTDYEDPAGESLQSQQAVGTQWRVELQDRANLQRDLPDNVELPLVVVSREVVEPGLARRDSMEHTSTPTQSGGTKVEIKESSIAPETAAVDISSTSPKPPLASDESSRPGSSRRAKLDLGAGKRLLFGALGIKAPKTKKDEEKVRSDFMKGVRPLILKKTTEEPQSDPVAEAVDEDEDNWRHKINYRAVECVQDDIFLSEPPFPFEQRWDPQQRTSYKGDRGGKRKQDQRDQAQYYHDNPRTSKKQKRRKGKHNYAEEQEYLDASYEPSYQDDSLASQFDDSTQTERLHDDDVAGKVNQQLMNETAEASQGPTDLLLLPDDPSTLPDLEDGQARVAMTIAFKQLVMSETTNWQPQISAYRTAIVVAITDSGELQLNLAMRDRDRSNKRYDLQTGERMYSKFEVADDSETDEDDNDNEGMLILSFGNLIDPKIVQEPPSNRGSDAATVTLRHDEEPANELEEAQCSHVTETPLNSDAAEPSQAVESKLDTLVEIQGIEVAPKPRTTLADSHLQESIVDAQAEPIADNIPSVDDSVLSSSISSLVNQVEENVVDAPSERPVENLPTSNVPILEPNTPSAEIQASRASAINNMAEHVSDEGRQKWTHFMREEGGFHSSVPSSLAKLFRPDGMPSPDGLEKLAQDMDMGEASLSLSYSPRFNGLGSSPTRKRRDASNSPEKYAREESPQLPQSSWETVENDEHASSPSRVIEQPQEDPAFRPLSAASEMRYPESEEKASVRTVPPSKALQEWQTRKQRRNGRAPASEAETSKTAPPLDLGFGVDGADERESIASVKYPELSVGSSFTSQIADHGHQPDFEDSLDLSANTPKGPSSEFDELLHDLQPNVVSEAARSASPNEAIESESVEVVTSDIEIDGPDLPPKRSVNKINAPQQANPETLEDDPSSEDLVLPTIEEMASSQKALEREHGTPTKNAKKDLRKKKTVYPFDDDFEDDQTTPKASQKQRSFSGNRNDRNSEEPASQLRASIPRASQTRPSQSQPQASQIVDLTMSSDVEPEPESEAEKSSRRATRRYDDRDDDSYEDEVVPKTGWKPRKDSNAPVAERRRHISVGLRPSSQGSLNTQNRRKTIAR
ncbi:hypothetical protein N431DRAFT_454155 [Stipitochalara longipes BDJ]|nr:hypothetical protein N431DRAFT_454155 [Stipitochalara longipes BDJ]